MLFRSAQAHRQNSHNKNHQYKKSRNSGKKFRTFHKISSFYTIFQGILFTFSKNNIQKEVIFIKRSKKIMRVLSRVFLSGISVLFLCAIILSASLFVYMKNIDPKIDESIFSDSLGLTTKIYSTSGENGENTEIGKSTRLNSSH